MLLLVHANTAHTVTFLIQEKRKKLQTTATVSFIPVQQSPNYPAKETSAINTSQKETHERRT